MRKPLYTRSFVETEVSICRRNAFLSKIIHAKLETSGDKAVCCGDCSGALKSFLHRRCQEASQHYCVLETPARGAHPAPSSFLMLVSHCAVEFKPFKPSNSRNTSRGFGAARRCQEALRKLIRKNAAAATWRRLQKSADRGEEAQRCSAVTPHHASFEDGRVERRDVERPTSRGREASGDDCIGTV